MSPSAAAGPSSLKRVSSSQPSSSSAKPKTARPQPSAPRESKPALSQVTSPAQARQSKAPGRSTALNVASVPPPVQDTRPPAADTKPVLDQGEEEWAELMRGSYGGKKGADWYAKGVKSVQVSGKPESDADQTRTNGSSSQPSSR